jgi:hypothetical protein
MRTKLAIVLFLASAVLLAWSSSPVAAAPPNKAKQKFEEAYKKDKPEKYLPGTKLTPSQFRYLAQAQIDVLSYMLALYYHANGRFPGRLAELMQSKLWICDFNNVITGEPIEPIQFTPTKEDFLTPDQEFGGGAPSPGQNEQGGPPMPDRGAPRMTERARRVNPQSVPASPGGVFYYGSGSSFQVIVFFDHDVYQEVHQDGPYNFYADSYAVRSETQNVPMDTPMLAEAVIVTQIIPKAFNALAFISDKPTLKPDEMAALGILKILAEAEALGIVPWNPYTGRPLAVSRSFAEGDVYTTDTGDGFPYYFCFPGGRLRTLDEMSDPKVYRAHQSEIASRR